MHDSYDNNVFSNTPYDLNRDGHIDPCEQAYINETVYKENEKGCHHVRRGISKGTIIVWIITIVLLIVFSKSPGIPLFFLMLAFSAKLSGFY